MHAAERQPDSARGIHCETWQTIARGVSRPRVRIGRAPREGLRVGAFPSFDITLAAAAIFTNIGQALQTGARIGPRLQQLTRAIQPHHADSARFVDRYAAAAMRSKILAPIVWPYLVSDPQPPLAVIGDRGISLIEWRRGHRDFRTPLARRCRRARIDIVAAVAVRVPSYSDSSRCIRGDRRIPLVAGRIRNRRRRGEPRHILVGREDHSFALPPALPGYP